jgi:hypothetical protein
MDAVNKGMRRQTVLAVISHQEIAMFSILPNVSLVSMASLHPYRGR